MLNNVFDSEIQTNFIMYHINYMIDKMIFLGGQIILSQIKVISLAIFSGADFETKTKNLIYSLNFAKFH
jgi:hypothetical protein